MYDRRSGRSERPPLERYQPSVPSRVRRSVEGDGRCSAVILVCDMPAHKPYSGARPSGTAISGANVTMKKAPENRSLCRKTDFWLARTGERGADWPLEAETRQVAVACGNLSALHQHFINKSNDLTQDSVRRSVTDGSSLGHFEGLSKPVISTSASPLRRRVDPNLGIPDTKLNS